MNSITDILDLEDSDIHVSNIQVEGTQKLITLEYKLTSHFCPSCGFRMHSRGIKTRSIRHPILQDGYELILLLRQLLIHMRWMFLTAMLRWIGSRSLISFLLMKSLRIWIETASMPW